MDLIRIRSLFLPSTTPSTTFEYTSRLHLQSSSGPKLEALPYADDAFFFETMHTYLSFDRSNGGVSAMRIHRAASEALDVWARTSGEPDHRQPAIVSPELYDLWSGIYEMRPGFVLEIRREGDRLISQATGQPSFELHPTSTNRYFVTEFPAEIQFEQGDDGRAQALILRQGGTETRAARVK